MRRWHVVSRLDCGNRQISRAQRRQRRGLLRAADRPREIPWRGADPPHAGLGRMDHRGDAQARPSRLRHHLPSPLFPRRPGSPDDVGARVRAAGGVADDQVVGDAEGAAACLRAQPARQRQGRRDRLLLRRPPRLPDRLQAPATSTPGRLLGRQRHRRRSRRRSTPSARSRRSISPTSSNARSSASSATTTRTRTRIRSTAPRRC